MCESLCTAKGPAHCSEVVKKGAVSGNEDMSDKEWMSKEQEMPLRLMKHTHSFSRRMNHNVYACKSDPNMHAVQMSRIKATKMAGIQYQDSIKRGGQVNRVC